jgi:hypothetical protein
VPFNPILSAKELQIQERHFHDFVTLPPQRQDGFLLDNTMSDNVLTPLADFIPAQPRNLISYPVVPLRGNVVTFLVSVNFCHSISNSLVNVTSFTLHFHIAMKQLYSPMKLPFCHNANPSLGGQSIQLVTTSDHIDCPSTSHPFPPSPIQPRGSLDVAVPNRGWPMC